MTAPLCECGHDPTRHKRCYRVSGDPEELCWAKDCPCTEYRPVTDSTVKLTAAPERIWLEPLGDEDDGWTWSAYSIRDENIGYVRLDILLDAERRIAELDQVGEGAVAEIRRQMDLVDTYAERAARLGDDALTAEEAEEVMPREVDCMQFPIAKSAREKLRRIASTPNKEKGEDDR